MAITTKGSWEEFQHVRNVTVTSPQPASHTHTHGAMWGKEGQKGNFQMDRDTSQRSSKATRRPVYVGCIIPEFGPSSKAILQRVANALARKTTRAEDLLAA